MKNIYNNTRTPEYERTSTQILLSHGSGGKMTHELITELFVRRFDNEYLTPLSDSALLPANKDELLFTTDSYVVNPYIFPGGDIGRLAVCGTVNDLAVSGAKPLFISCGLIIEEGFEIETLEMIVDSMATAAKEAGVKIVTGDTKVVEKGSADGIFINTAGIGTKERDTGIQKISIGDKIIINGNIGDHGMAVMSARNGLNISSNIVSDCAPLYGMISALRGSDIHFMRDPTRGGVATTLVEIAEASGFEIEIDELVLPIFEGVRGISEVLGIDPVFSANEGKVIIVAPADSAAKVVELMRKHSYGANAAIIGEVKATRSSRVFLKTTIGTKREVTMPAGPLLPRIC